MLCTSSRVGRALPSSLVNLRRIVALRYTSNGPSSSTAASNTSFLPRPTDISVVPFKLSPQVAREVMTNFAFASPAKPIDGLRSGLEQMLHSALPFFPSPFEVVEEPRALFLPGWSVDAEVTAVTASLRVGEEFLELMPPERRALLEITNNVSVSVTHGFFPGTSFYPLSHISLSHRLRDLGELDRYNPAEHGSHRVSSGKAPVTIRAMPFDTSPLVLPDMARSIEDVRDKSVTIGSGSNIRWKSLEAAPLYFPIYVAVLRDRRTHHEITAVMEAASEDPRENLIFLPARGLSINEEPSWNIYPRKPLETPPGMLPQDWMEHTGRKLVPGDVESNDVIDVAMPPLCHPRVDVYPGPKGTVKETEEFSSHNAMVSPRRLKHHLERWLDAPGRRQRLRKASLEERPEGSIGEIKIWEEYEDAEEEEDEGEDEK